MNEYLVRIREVIAKIDISDTAFAKRIGVSQSSFSSLFTRDVVPKSDILEKISNAYMVDPGWLLTGNGEMFLVDNINPSEDSPLSIQTEKKEIVLSDRDDVVMVPVLEQKISAGAGQDYIEEYSSDVTIPILDKIIHPYPRHSIKVVEVRGDSMTGVEIFDGDYVIFSQGELRADGIYVISIGSDLFVKRLEFDPIERRLTIISENPSYEKKVVDADSDVVRVEGKVIGWIHRHPY